jgi:hypothetical protein
VKNAELVIIRQVAVIFKLLHNRGNVDYFIVENMNRVGLVIKSGKRSLLADNAQNALHFRKRHIAFFHSGSDAPVDFVNSINHFFVSFLFKTINFLKALMTTIAHSAQILYARGFPGSLFSQNRFKTASRPD